MTDIGETTHEVKYSAATKTFPLKVGVGIVIGEFPTLHLTEPTGLISMTIDQRVFPMLRPGDMVIAQLGFVRGEVVSSSSIIRPKAN